jgi:magnesium transporter
VKKSAGGLKMADLNFKMISFNRRNAVRSESIDPAAFKEMQSDGLIHWIEVPNLGDRESIEEILKSAGIHHLIIEDILNPGQMVKMDIYDDCLFIVLKMLGYNRGETNITTEHVSIVLRDNQVISFEEQGGLIFEGVRDRIEQGRDNIRDLGPDYLCYELVNTVVDNYFSVVDELGDVIDSIEEELISKPDKNTLAAIYFVKRKLMFLRKSVYPLRELIGSLFRSGSKLIGADVKIYFHDVYDHLIQIVDSIETYQDILSNMLDTYLSSISNRTNDTMKILTIFSTIFIPLTFLAGIYGMNFKNIPELSMRYGYLIFWIASAAIAAVMLMFFHRKKWF